MKWTKGHRSNALNGGALTEHLSVFGFTAGIITRTGFSITVTLIALVEELQRNGRR